MAPLLELDRVSKRLRSGDTETQALAEVSLAIETGSFVAVTGPSGCGKSTLLGIAGLIDRPTAGELRLAGRSTGGLSEGELAALRCRNIGFVFQSFNLIDDLTVRQNIELPMVYAGIARADRRRRSDELMDRLGVAHRASHRPEQLSGGQQQRVAIARAVATAAQLVLADEPAGNLDTAHGNEVMKLLRGLADAGTTVLMVTHAPEHARRADRVVRMRDGRIVADAAA